jgi:hypothetical protein
MVNNNNNQKSTPFSIHRHLLKCIFIVALLLMPNSTIDIQVRAEEEEEEEETSVDVEVEVEVEEEETPKTGSFQNCTQQDDETFDKEILSSHPDSDMVIISCTPIHYRVPSKSIAHIVEINKKSIIGSGSGSGSGSIEFYENEPKYDIVIGVLSSAAGRGPSRRNYIRSTWAYRKRNIFFIVAGEWDDEIQNEYDNYGDLFWIDREETYDSEDSVLTFKSQSFVTVMYNKLMTLEEEAEEEEEEEYSDNANVSFLFKTDDDSYVALNRLHHALMRESDYDYWGKCNEAGWKPHRDKSNKWYLGYEIYPEPEYPAFCQGAGIAMSKYFLDCAVGYNHTSNVRYLPNEDVAIGMLAERCDISISDDDRVWIRYDHEDDKVTMHKKIVQHYVKDERDMRDHHQSVTGVRGPRLMQH